MAIARRVLGVLSFTAVLTLPAVAAQTPPHDETQEVWQSVEAPDAPGLAPSAARTAPGAQKRIRTLSLNHRALAAFIAKAPRERTRAAREQPLVLSLPAPEGGFQRFAVEESPIMEPALAAKHPEIKTYNGRGIDNPASTIRFDLTPLGFHASVRGPQGSWYIDPQSAHDTSVYRTFFGREIVDNPHGRLVERDGEVAEISTDRGYYHPPTLVSLKGSGFAPLAPIVVTVTGNDSAFAPRTVDAAADETGAFEVAFVADLDGNLGAHLVEATDATSSATAAYDVVTEDDSSVDPAVGDLLRTYRLALVTDHNYANYFLAENVTAAKVTLINRVNHVYEDETSIRLVLIGNNDVLNLNTAAVATGANGPCGAAPCFTPAQITGGCTGGILTRNRQVVGLLVGASNYDIGHLALGVNGGGVASLGVVGGNSKAQGCTGLPQPVGDFFAVDYVAHEMGHQFGGNHPFNGTDSNCSGGNRSAGNSVEPGSGSSIMAYAGICRSDNLQPHSDPYWSMRSFDEIVTVVTAADTNINEVQIGALTGFDTNGDSFQVQYNGNVSAPIVRGTNYSVAGIQAAIQGIAGWPAGALANVSAVSDTAFTVTFAGTLAGTDVSFLTIVNPANCSGYVGEIARGGLTNRGGRTVTATGNHPPVVTAPAQFTIPLRTPFALTGSGTDQDGETLTYMWEQTDRGGLTGTNLLSNTKANGPLFRQFGTRAVVTPADTLLYNSPGENTVTTDPTRVFPDLAQILANNTNAEAGGCPVLSPVPNPVPADVVDCYSEFLPNASYVGFTSTTGAPFNNSNPLSLHFRLTARDGHPGSGGVNGAPTTLLLTPGTGPFLVTSPNTSVTYPGASTQAVTWNVAGTDVAPINTTDVRISLSVDGGLTYPYELAAATANDGAESVALPNVGTTRARVKIEAVGNVFFDLSNADFTIQALPVVTNTAPAGGASVQYSDALSPAVTVSAADADSDGSALVAVATGLPAGLSLAPAVTSVDAARPGTASWTVAGLVTAAPGTYDVTVTVTEETGGAGSTSFTIIVTAEDAQVVYTGDTLAFTGSGSPSATVLLRATVRDSALVASFGDMAPGLITNATVTFKEGATTLCGPLPVALLDGTTTATASCPVPLWPGAHSITVEVGGYYIGSTTSTVEVKTGEDAEVEGEGYLVAGGSGGSYKADRGSKVAFQLEVKFKSKDKDDDRGHDRDGRDKHAGKGGHDTDHGGDDKGPKYPKGEVEIAFRSGGKAYMVKTTAIESLGVAFQTAAGAACGGDDHGDRHKTCVGFADIRAKATLLATDPQSPVSVATGLTLQVTATDKGQRGLGDTIGISLWSGNTLLFSSNWNGTNTVEQALAAGKITVD